MAINNNYNNNNNNKKNDELELSYDLINKKLV